MGKKQKTKKGNPSSKKPTEKKPPKDERAGEDTQTHESEEGEG